MSQDGLKTPGRNLLFTYYELMSIFGPRCISNEALSHGIISGTFAMSVYAYKI